MSSVANAARLPEETVSAAPGRRVVALSAVLVALAMWTWQIGFPTGRLQVFLWLWATAIAWRIHLPVRRQLDFVRDWWLPAVVMLGYGYSRGVADNLGLPVHWQWPINIDRLIGGGMLPTQRLQDWWCGGSCADSRGPVVLDALGTSVYASHFVAAWIVAVVLWLRNRDAWVRWMSRLLSVNVLGIAAAVLVPTAPPWLASRHGYLDPSITRLTGSGWSDVGVGFSQLLVGPLANEVAAMPSIHTATAALVALYAVQRLRTPWRWLTLAYPAAMCATLTYFGEHYVVDELAGIVLALLVLAFWSWWERRPSARRRQNVGGAS